MAKLAFFSIPAQGHTNPTLPLAQELTRRGHTVRYYSYEPFRQKIRQTGAEFLPCDAFDAHLRLTEEEAARVGSDLALSVRVLVDTTLCLNEMVLEQMTRWKPDGIVFDSMAPWGKAAAKKLGIPCLCSNTTFAFNRHSARIMKQSLRELLQMLLALPRTNRELARLRAAGYPVKSVLDLIGADESIPTIVYTSRAFQPAGETFGENFAFIGPLPNLPREEIRIPGRPLVYASMGTVNNGMLPLYQSCLQALEGRSAILSVGQRVNLSDLGPLPPSIQVCSHVDQIAVLQKADVFLTHCGMNSVSEALYYGVPLVMNPKTKEQQGVADRVAALGAGIFLPAESPQAIRAAVDTVLSDPKYRESAGQIGKSFRECSGVTGAADFIEKTVQGQ